MYPIILYQTFVLNTMEIGNKIENWFSWFKEKVDSQDCLCINTSIPN